MEDRPGSPRPGLPIGRKATISDVARLAGVGRQTVSNVLNGNGRVGEQARARVLAVVAELDYQPHLGARSLRSRRTYQVAYLMPRDQLEPANLIMQQFVQALAAAAARRRYGVLVVVPGPDPLADLRRQIGNRSADAFVLSELAPDDARVALLAAEGIPFACFGRTGPGLPEQWVDIDNQQAAADAVEHLVATGRTSIGFAGYRPDSSWDADRLSGFSAGLTRCGLDPAAAPVALVDNASARRKIRSLLATGQLDALVTGSDRLAAVAYDAAADLDLRIGTDLAVTGFDGSVAASLLRPSLTSVAIPVEEIARRVLDRALHEAAGGNSGAPGEVVAARLRAGDSTRPAPGPARLARLGAGQDQERRRASEDAPQGAGTEQPAEPGLDGGRGRTDNEDASTWKRFHGGQTRPRGDKLRGQGRVTIAEVAAAAGVGTGTVSRVLNGSSQVRPATAHAVTTAARQLGYRPSHAAAALVRGTPQTVAVMVTHLTRPSAVARVAGALTVLEQQGYDAIVCNVDSPAERDRHLAALLPTHRADGVLAISLPLPRRDLDQFRSAGVALVMVDAVAAGVPVTVISDADGGRLATDHLLALGHRRIGFVGDEVAAPPAGLGFTSSASRMRGYRQALTAAGVPVRPGLVRLGRHDAATAAELAAELLKLAEPPSAIFAASDTQALGVLAAADRLGISVPEDLSVVGFDDIESAGLLGLSTVRQPLARSGAEGARRLCAVLRGQRIAPLRQELAVELIARGSSARPASPTADAGPAASPGTTRSRRHEPEENC
jgi:DNA-binding LacI/PurR family transcriptional regulator